MRDAGDEIIGEGEGRLHQLFTWNLISRDLHGMYSRGRGASLQSVIKLPAASSPKRSLAGSHSDVSLQLYAYTSGGRYVSGGHTFKTRFLVMYTFVFHTLA